MLSALEQVFDLGVGAPLACGCWAACGVCSLIGVPFLSPAREFTIVEVRFWSPSANTCFQSRGYESAGSLIGSLHPQHRRGR